MKKRAKRFAVMLVAILLLVQLAACGKEKETENNTAPTAEPTPEITGELTPEATPTPFGAFDKPEKWDVSDDTIEENADGLFLVILGETPGIKDVNSKMWPDYRWMR